MSKGWIPLVLLLAVALVLGRLALAEIGRVRGENAALRAEIAGFVLGRSAHDAAIAELRRQGAQAASLATIARAEGAGAMRRADRLADSLAALLAAGETRPGGPDWEAIAGVCRAEVRELREAHAICQREAAYWEARGDALEVALDSSEVRLQAATDLLDRAGIALAPPWWKLLPEPALTVGPSLLVAADGDVEAGVGGTAGLRLFRAVTIGGTGLVTPDGAVRVGVGLTGGLTF